MLYLLAALALVALVGAGAYLLLDYYFQNITDLALRYRMAVEFRRVGLVPPQELLVAEEDWAALRPVAPTIQNDHEDDDEDEHNRPPGKVLYDGELAPIYALQLAGQTWSTADPGLPAPPFVPDQLAADQALTNGFDTRTTYLADGTRVRLLTYRLPESNGSAAIQLGRPLADQDRALGQILAGLLVLGGLSAALLGIGSWWLSGRALRPAQQAWEQQQTFVANASHELRAPLTLMRASAEVALRGVPPADNDQRMLLDDIVRECDHMSRLVEDLLLLSRLDAGRLELARQPIALHDLLQEVGRQIGRVAAERGVHVVIEPATGIAQADPTRVRQVLLILLDNALRYTPSGGIITILATIDRTSAHISVTDTGSGIGPDHLPHIFERFYRANSGRGTPGGSGLGLSIARALVEAQGGRISVESQPGQGARFVVVLPAPPLRHGTDPAVVI